MAIKVLIIDDSALVRETMTNVLQSDPEIRISGTAADPIFGARKISRERPDVIILDIEMARMDGLTFLKRMNETSDPIPCVICSSTVSEGSPNALKALEYGACSVIEKPVISTRKFIEESKIIICDAVKAAYLGRKNIRKLFPASSGNPFHEVHAKLSADVILQKPDKKTLPAVTTDKVIVMGASTGGTEALKEVLIMLPPDIPGVVIVQHMPEHFTRAFASRLDSLCKITVKEAENGDEVLPGRALIAPGNRHTLLKRNGSRYFVEVREGPLVSRHRPSVDVLFRSAARYAGKNVIGVIMTGMGDDGAKGMKEMHDAGAYTIAQDESSCIVFGMPAEAIRNGGVDQVVPLQNIAHAVLAVINTH
jgi:two-component system, chemotaxis family, protein-glutamate methylesterase/glutaminase